MKKLFLFLLIGSISYQLNAQTKMDSLSYSVGVMMAQGLKSQNLTDLTPEDLAKGINDVLKDQTLAISKEDAENIFRDHLQAQKASQHTEAVAAGKAFLEANKKRPEVKTTASGLQYEIMKEGTGTKPTTSSQVKVHYHGTLIDGTVFDSSVERGQPAEFGVTQVISGWTEALQLMPTGSKWKLFLPYDLAYGDRGAGPKIGPFSTLIFEVELLEIK